MGSSITKALLSEISAYIRARGIKASSFGKLAANNPRLVARLEAGGDCRTSTVERIKRFLAEHQQ